MKRSSFALSILSISVGAALLAGCVPEKAPESTSGVQKATVQVAVNPNTGRTVEQDNIAGRLKMDNTPGSVKHLYIIAPESGQVIIYSTVQGKVTSSGKRLSPKTVNSSTWGFKVQFGNETHYTSEVLQDDGTYGDSAEYIYWFDAQGRYHQHYFTGGQIIHVSDQPIQVKNVVINMELTAAPGVVVPAASTVKDDAPVAPAAADDKVDAPVAPAAADDKVDGGTAAPAAADDKVDGGTVAPAASTVKDDAGTAPVKPGRTAVKRKKK